MKANIDVGFWRELKASRPFLTKQQYRTIKGGLPRWGRCRAQRDRGADRQTAVKGKVVDARKGLQKVLMRRNVK